MKSKTSKRSVFLRHAAVVCAAVLTAANARAQTDGHGRSAEEINGDLHMEMTPARRATKADSVRAAGVAALLREALEPYADTTAAVAGGYKMFMPENTHQKTYHFTNNWHAVKEAFRFDPAKPASLLYRKGDDGRFVLIGAMYTAPKKFGPDKLDARVPLSVARWHKHVNWCLPRKNDKGRWIETSDGHAVFGPASPIATKSACDAVGGNFQASVFGWMLHANVFAGDDPAKIWGDDRAGHDMHAGMKMGMEP